MTAGRYDDLHAKFEHTGELSSGDVARLIAALRESEEENARHQKANLVRAVMDPLWEQHEGWVADYIAREDFDAIPWRVAQNLVGVGHELAAARAEVETLRTELAHERSQRWALAKLLAADSAAARAFLAEATPRPEDPS